MKILFFSHSFYPAIGGIESISKMLADEFNNLGHEVRILTTTASEEVNVFPYQVLRNVGDIQIMKELRWCDVAFENNPCMRMSWTNILIRKPMVTGLQTWIVAPNQALTFQNKLKLIFLRNSAKLIACSEAVRQNTALRAIVIGNPFDDKVFRINTQQPKIKDFVFLGRLVSDKGAEIAIKAFEQFSIDNLSSNLTIIGDGPEMNNLKKLVKKHSLGSLVDFAGALKGKELVDKLNEFKYMIVPSLWEEPFGIVALEGMACGCIPIVSNGGGLPDAVGKAGLLFERGSAENLFQTMKRIYNEIDLKTKLTEAAPLHLEAHLCSKVAQQYLSVFREALNE